jgi:O-antigen/teichoic acid export membrane protein
VAERLDVSNGPHLLRSGLIYAGANALAAGVPFLLLPVLTRALAPAEYGVVVSFFMLVTLCTATAGLSVHAAVGVRWLQTAAGDARHYTGTAMVLAIGSTVLTAAIAAAVAPRWLPDLDAALCAAAAFIAGAMVLQGMRFAVWQSRARPVPAALLQVASALLNVLLSLGAVLLLQWGSAGRIAGATLAGLLAAGASVALLVRADEARAPTAADLRSLLRFGVPLVPHTLAGALLVNADRLAVSAKIDATALGVYGTAFQLGMVMNVLADAALKAYTPALYGLLNDGSARARLRVVAVAVASVPASVAAALLLWALYRAAGGLLLGPGYEPAIGLSIWFLLGGAASAVYLNVAGLFFFTGKTEWISAATACAAAFALLVAPPAVERLGLAGGGAAYLASHLVLLGAAWMLSRRVVPMPWHRPGLALRILARGTRPSAA